MDQICNSHFGREVIAQLCGWDLKERAADVEKVYLKIYQVCA